MLEQGVGEKLLPQKGLNTRRSEGDLEQISS